MLKLFAVIIFSTSIWAADQKTVAMVGTKTITLEEFNKRYADVKSKTTNPPTKKAFLEDLIRYEMGLQEAEKKKVSTDPTVAERIRQEIYKGLLEKELAAKISALNTTPDELKAYYKTSPEIRSSHILIEVKPNANAQEKEAAKKRAGEIYADVKKSKRPFEELVALYTDDLATKKNGGDIGFQNRLTIYPSYYDAISKMSPGEISNIVETPYGFHIIKVTKKNTFEEANKMQIRAIVFEKKKLALFNEYFDKLKKNYKVAAYPELLN